MSCPDATILLSRIARVRLEGERTVPPTPPEAKVAALWAACLSSASGRRRGRAEGAACLWRLLLRSVVGGSSGCSGGGGGCASSAREGAGEAEEGVGSSPPLAAPRKAMCTADSRDDCVGVL